jgi:hypothetical protein
MQCKESSGYYIHVWTNKQDLKFSQQCSGLKHEKRQKEISQKIWVYVN